MKKRIFEEKIIVTPQERLDLVILFYIFSNRLSNIITRIYWQDKAISQTKTIKLGRKPVLVRILPDDVRFSHDMKSIRVTGRVLEAMPEEGVKGRRLGIDIHINDEVGLENKKEVAKFIEIVEDVGYEEFLIIAVDTSGVALARIGNNINMLEEVYLPSSKFYEARIESMSETLDRIFSIIKEIKEREETKVVAAVNTSTKKMIRKYRKLIDLVIEGDFTGTMTGILQVLRSKKIRELNVKNEVLKNIETYEKLLKNMFSDRIIYGMDNIKMAIENKGITNLYVNYQLLLEKPEIIEYIIIALEKRISVTIADRKDFLGMAVSKFGDIVGIY